MLRHLLFITFLFFTLPAFSQQSNPYKIRKQKWWWWDRCKSYEKVVSSFPEDVRFNVIVEDRTIYFTMASIQHFEEVFDKNKDGIAIDIIHQDQYACGEEMKASGIWPGMGYLMPPMYKKEMLEKLRYDQLNNVIIEYGTLPEQFEAADVECNVIVLQKRASCDYSITQGMTYGNFDLLETGLYWDVTPENKKTSSFSTSRKVTHFIISFEKNKAVYKQEDIKPLYDSLRLTDFTIKEIAVDAYSSVEGSVENNEQLQKKRAQSIIDALQKFQTEEVKTKITTKENWRQFANDLAGTEFEYLKKYSKEKLKKKLAQDSGLLAALEPLLAKQRKGVIRLTLQKKEKVYEDPQQMVSAYYQTLAEKDMKRALALQQKIFDKIRNEQLPDAFIDKLEVPKTSEFGPVLSNIILFRHERYSADLLQTIHEMDELLELMPENPKLKYNLLVLEIKAWSQGTALGFNRKTAGELLKEVSRSDIPSSLVNRLQINYNLLLIQYLTYEKKFVEKRKPLRDLLYYYRQSELDYEDTYRLAKFLAFNSEFDLATEIIYPKRLDENIPEDLLFYFIRLTIKNEKRIRKYLSNEVIEKAVAMNAQRFCELYLPVSQGGYSFQIKEFRTMKEAFCTYCSDVAAN